MAAELRVFVLECVETMRALSDVIEDGEDA